MTATEEVCRLLDERGVEWHDTKIGKGFITVFEHDGITWIVTEHSSGRLSVKGCVKPTQGHYDGMTPAQAIAATLGRGMLTADDVRDLIERHSDASGGNGRDFHNGAYVAITDELNAVLGRDTDATGKRQRDAGTCTVDATVKWDWDRCEPYWKHELSCGHVATTMEPEPPRYCSHCGAKVEDA